MDNNFFVYVDGLVGVETNLRDFRWGFGKSAPRADEAGYEKCLIKIKLRTRRDKEIAKEAKTRSGKFRDFTAEKNADVIYYARSIKGIFNLAYRIEKEGNTLTVDVGKNYFRFVKLKVMHIHPIWYVLFDMVTAMLIEQGYLPLYSSSVVLKDKRTVAMLAPANTGKSLTALQLVRKHGASLIAEDLAITDGEYIRSVPYTDSYRNYGKDLKGTLVPAPSAERKRLDSIVVLERGEHSVKAADDGIVPTLQLLNNYLLGYSKSTAVDVFCYFNGEFDVKQLRQKEEAILTKLVKQCECCCISEPNALNYADTIMGIVKGE